MSHPLLREGEGVSHLLQRGGVSRPLQRGGGGCPAHSREREGAEGAWCPAHSREKWWGGGVSHQLVGRTAHAGVGCARLLQRGRWGVLHTLKFGVGSVPSPLLREH